MSCQYCLVRLPPICLIKAQVSEFLPRWLHSWVGVYPVTSRSSEISDIKAMLIINFSVKFYCLRYWLCVQYRQWNFWIVSFNISKLFFFLVFFKKRNRYCKFPVTGFTGLLLGDLWYKLQGLLLLPSLTIWSVISPCSFRAT